MLSIKPQHILVASIALASFLCYFNSYQCDFVFDDLSAVKSNQDIRPTTPLANIFYNDFWGTPMTEEKSHGSYRPLCTLTFRLNYSFFGLDPMYFHLTNVVLHVWASLLVYFCLFSLSFAAVTSWFAAMLFAVHPIHAEAVTGVVGRAELLSGIFYLTSIVCYIFSAKCKGKMRFIYLLLSLCSIPLSSLSKEAGITVAGLLVTYEIIVVAKWKSSSPLKSLGNACNLNSVFRLLTVLATTCLFLFVRLKLMPQMPHFSVLDNPAAHAKYPAKQLTYAYLVPINVHLLLYPWPLIADWALGTVPLVRSFSDPRNVITAVFFIAFLMAIIIVLYRMSWDYHLTFCFAMIIVPFIPASNLFFPVGFVVADRVLYLPSIGWCALVALGFERLLKRFVDAALVDKLFSNFDKYPKNWSPNLSSQIRCVLYAVVIVLGTFFLRSYLRNYDWLDQVSLFRAGLRFNQQNAKLFNNVGHTYETDQKWPEAFAYFYKAVRTHPTDVGAHRNVARALKNMNQIQFALRALRRAIRLIPSKATVETGIIKTRVTPGHLDSFLDLAAILASAGTHEALVEAEDLYSKVLQMRPGYMPAYERRGEIMFKLGRLDDAREMFKRGVERDDRCSNCYYNMAVVDITQSPNDVQKLSGALGLLDMAIQIDPEHYHAMHAFASVVQERRVTNLYDTARAYMKKVIESEQQKINTLDNPQLMDKTMPSASAARISDAYFRAAMLETDLHNFQKAKELYLDALKRDPNGRSLLFNTAWLHYKDLHRPLDSLPYLKRLVKAHPDHTSGWLLMGYVHLNHTFDYKKAREAFEKVVQVAPNDPDKTAASSAATSYYELCRLFEKEGLPKKAVVCLEEMGKNNPNDPTFGTEIANIKRRNPDVFT